MFYSSFLQGVINFIICILLERGKIVNCKGKDLWSDCDKVIPKRDRKNVIP